MKYAPIHVIRIAFFFSVATLLIAVPLSAKDQLAVRDIAAAGKLAVATVRAYANEQEIGLGSGFFIREDGVLVTNLHVLNGADSVSIETDSGEIYDNVYVLARDDRRDLILLQIPVSGVSTLDIADDRSTEVGDPVYVIGSPLGLQGTFSDGLLSAKRIENGVAYLQISAPISQGSSGGPVLNHNGQVIGVATLTIADGQNLNLAIPARHAADLLRLAGNPIPFESLAAEVPATGTTTIGERASETAAMLEVLSGEARAKIENLNPYQRQVALRVLWYAAVGEEIGYEFTDDSQYGTLELGKIDRLSANLEKGNYIALGVCDDDCVDLDIYVLDEGGDVVASDVLGDAEPMADFTVPKRGNYFIGVRMESCATGDCVYAIRLLRQE